MITFTLTDQTDSQTYTLYEAPFEDAEEGGEEMVTTLDGNVYVDFLFTKRTWTREFKFMREADYLTLKGFVDRQRTTYKFPTLTITEFGVSNVPVYVQISERKTTNACGDVEDVQITMRETVQQ